MYTTIRTIGASVPLYDDQWSIASDCEYAMRPCPKTTQFLGHHPNNSCSSGASAPADFPIRSKVQHVGTAFFPSSAYSLSDTPFSFTTMSTYRIDPLEYSNPPPAYNDREFDQKTSLATEASLQTPRPPTPEISEERWAEIEEAAFQAAIAASLADSTPTESFSIPDQGQPSRTIEPGPPSPTRNRSPVPTTAPRRFPTVKPLRMEKKTRSPNASVDLKHEKEKNKWITEEESAYPSQAGSSSHGHGDYEDDIAPPPFAETAPHGSQYHEPSYHDVGHNPPYSAGHPSATIPSADISPNLLLQSLDSLSISSAIFSDHQPTAHPLPPPPPPAPSHGNNRQSMPVSPSQEPTACRTVHRTRSFTPQPSSSFVDPSSTHQAMNAPMMHFNPSVAYGKSPFARLQTPPPPGMEEGQEVVYRANAFYKYVSAPTRFTRSMSPTLPCIHSAAVSAHLTPKTPSQRSTGDQRPSYAYAFLSCY